MVMMGVIGREAAVRALEILLDGDDIVLSSRKVAGLEIGRKLVEGLRCRARSRGRGGEGTGSSANSGGRLRKGSLQGSEIGLRGREIAGLEVLAELLDLLLVIRALI